MVTPQPPSVEFELSTQRIAPAYSRIFRLVLIGNDVGGTAAASALTDKVVAGPFHDLPTALGRVASTSDLAHAIRVIFGQDITPEVYLVATDGALTDTALRTNVIECITAAKLINPPIDFIYAVDVTEGGYKAAAAGSSVAIAAALEVAAEELDAIAVIDSPDITFVAYIAWLKQAASPLKRRVRPVFNRVVAGGGVSIAGGAYFLGAAIRQASRFGRQAGINLAPVLGVSGLKYEMTYSPINTLDTHIKTLVNNYGSALFNGDSGTEIVGDTFKGYEFGDPQQYWSPVLVIDHALTQARIAAAPFIGNDSIGNTPAYRRGLATIIADSLDESVRNGELFAARARPHPSRNTPASLAARTVVIQTFLTVILPTNKVIVEANILI